MCKSPKRSSEVNPWRTLKAMLRNLHLILRVMGTGQGQAHGYILAVTCRMDWMERK